MKTFKGKTALVTGASSGIGLALARALAKQGAHLVITARSEDKLNEIAGELRKEGVEVHVFRSDLSQKDAAVQLFEQVEQAGLRVDLLVNNAGFGKWGEFLEVSRDRYEQLIQLNITALTEMCHLFIPGMLARGEGGIINVGSTASFIPVPYAAVYSATKGYVMLFTEALQGEYGQRGLSCMTLCPGGTETNFATVANPDVRLKATDFKDSPEFVAGACLKAFLRGDLYVIPGAGNQVVAYLPRILTRKMALKVVTDNWKKTIGRN